MTDHKAKIIDGKRIADDLLDSLKVAVDARIASGKSAPGLAVILVGADPASTVYVRNKRRAAKIVGIRAIDYDLPASTSNEELLELLPGNKILSQAPGHYVFQNASSENSTVLMNAIIKAVSEHMQGVDA